MRIILIAALLLLLAAAVAGAVCAVRLKRVLSELCALHGDLGNAAASRRSAAGKKARGRLAELRENWRARIAAKEIEASESV